MSNILPLATPHPPVEDWTPALHNTVLEGSLYWVINQENLVIDATPDIADAAGVPISSYIGAYAHEIGAEYIVEPSPEDRAKRRERIFQTGKSETTLVHADLPYRGWTAAVLTSTRLTHPDTGRRYLLNAAQDITDLNHQLAYLRAPAFQGLVMLIIENDGTVLAATDAAAKFCNPAFQYGHELHGATIEQTDFADLKVREAAELERCRESDLPAHAIEWLLAGDDSYRPYAVTRICFPEGRWMLVLMPVPTEIAPYMQLDQVKHLKKLLKARNLRAATADKKLTKTQFKTLVDVMQRVPEKEVEARDNLKEGGAYARKAALAQKLGLDGVPDIYGAMRYTDLGYLAQLYDLHVLS